MAIADVIVQGARLRIMPFFDIFREISGKCGKNRLSIWAGQSQARRMRRCRRGGLCETDRYQVCAESILISERGRCADTLGDNRVYTVENSLEDRKQGSGLRPYQLSLVLRPSPGVFRPAVPDQSSPGID
jgi:hypothetical protein